MTSVEVRTQLVEALELDLVGPSNRDPQRPLGNLNERLSQSPSRWYLTGFLVPAGAGPEQILDPASDEELDATPPIAGADEDVVRETAPASQRRLPTSMGLSVLVPAEAKHLQVRVSWGDYVLEDGETEVWRRLRREEVVPLPLPSSVTQPKEYAVPNSKGLCVALLVRPVSSAFAAAGLPAGVRTVSVFLVNRRQPAADVKRDEAFAFQTELEIHTDAPLVARPNLRGLLSEEWDERVADLQYRDDGEYVVGHNVASEACFDGDANEAPSRCRTRWVPRAEVERVAPPKEIKGVTLEMDNLASLTDGNTAFAALSPLVTEYRKWIDEQAALVPESPASRKETGQQLINEARAAAGRIQRGVELLRDPECLEAFRLANRAMADAARRRLTVMRSKAPESVTPAWYPFQLAFLLMNLPGIAEPESDDRTVVDLLFFPTGGGKTEAYLGLAAFTLVLRRLRNPGVGGAGVSVLMRYTLRLLTLDQLSRAATLICALELLREENAKLGDWPFEIGLWVGRAATPNQMGSKDRDNPYSARRKTRDFKNDDRKPSPIPLEECPWCGTKFTANSFDLYANGKPNQDYPTDLLIRCVNVRCAFTRERRLPLIGVDEPLYRRLPCFVIATVDKFAALPWTGPVGAMFGRVQRYDRQGFYGPCHPSQGSMLPLGGLLPPDLIIQDELHLISGPLGTMAGLYESAIEQLCVKERNGHAIRPKIVASTATVRRADAQIRALFDRERVDVFPPPGPNRRDSFFAEALPVTESNARLYVGVSSQGRSPKVALLRVYRALLCAAQKQYAVWKKKRDPENPADPYMTLLGYFNALRELGGARRLIEDEIRTQSAGQSSRKRVGETTGSFADREIDYVPVELTSRVNTAEVSQAKRTLALPFSDDKSADVAIATNMISVGLDITRLGLMVVFGQPKTTAEYIQATSRVGRDPQRPGLVVTILNVHKPRDRSHYERFTGWHETFYRGVEATSVTPFSPRAMDRGLAPAMVGLARQKWEEMTPPRGADQVLAQRVALDAMVDLFGDRASRHNASLTTTEVAEVRRRVRRRVTDLLEAWAAVVQDNQKVGAAMQYNLDERGAPMALLRDYLDPELRNLPAEHWMRKFRANRSLRDVEPGVNIWARTMDNIPVEED
ncbi:MAG: hypothetical protein JNK87_42830 [Bryobacterales bacterium]|nr:hypothetical protein [Bryobacterales bacterium]